MQRDKRDFGTRRAARLQHLRRKMKSRRWRCHRSFFLRIHGLVSLTVRFIGSAVDIRRQWHRPDAFKNIGERLVRKKTQCPLAKIAASDNLGRKRVAKQQFVSWANPLRGPNERFPKSPVTR